jgi:deazaflavin-dependent oxidoreductase (nitroreductase family)
MSDFARLRARFNRRVANRIVRPISGQLPIWSIVEHVGRRSGKTYQTPVSVFRTPDGVAILLAYGTDSDWLRNVQAADGGRIKLGGKTFAVTDPRVVATADAAELIQAPWRQLVKMTGTKHALLLTRAS